MHWRKLHLPDRVVKYFIKGGQVIFRTPKKYVASYEAISGWSYYEVERACAKRYFHLTPQQCKDYIMKILDEEE